MAKFYVQSGNFKTTITADDAEKAALWAVHRVMTQVLPFHAGDSVDAAAQGHRLADEGLLVLGEVVLVSEQGFDSPSQTEMDTFDLQIHWHQLTIALARLEAMVMPTDVDSHDEALCALM